MAAQPELTENRLLALLPDEDLARLAQHFVMVNGRDHDMVYAATDEMEFAYFPIGGVCSLIATDAAGDGVEMASVGREGMLGLPGALSGARMIGETVQQISGPMVRIPIADLRREVERRGALSQILERYTVALLSAIGQGVVCNRHHPVDSRAARWLLATHDRAGKDRFRLTQDFLATMLGVTRPQVTVAAASLRRAGMISYHRGDLQILDRAGLEGASCECYFVLRDEFVRLLGDSNGRPWVPVGG